MVDGMREYGEDIQRELERQPTHIGKRELYIAPNLAEYGVKSIIRKQKQYCEVTYIVKYRDDTLGRDTEFIWDVPNNHNGQTASGQSYHSFQEQIADCPDRFPDLEARAKASGLSNGLWKLLLFLFREDLEYQTGWRNLSPQFNYSWRAAELSSHPEYGPNGENALDVFITTDQKEDTQITPQVGVILSESSNVPIVNVSQYLGGKRGILVDRIKSLSEPYEVVRKAFLYCEWCFTAGTYNDDTYKEFDPPVKPECVKYFIPLHDLCPICNYPNPRLVNSVTTTVWDITLGLESSIRVTGVTVFDLAKNDIVAVDYEEQIIANKKSLRCLRLQVLSEHDILTLKNYLNSNESSPLPDSFPKQNINLKIRKLFFEICERRSMTTAPIVLFSEGLREIYDNSSDSNIKSSPIFSLDSEGKLNFDIANNYALKQFRDSLTIYQQGDNGKLIRVGITPTRFKFEATKTTS